MSGQGTRAFSHTARFSLAPSGDSAFQRLHRREDAIASYGAATAVNPDRAEARWLEGLVQLARGALAPPVWVLLPNSPDWRWMLDREDSPWGPTPRLLRQPRAADWESVVERVVEARAALHTERPGDPG